MWSIYRLTSPSGKCYVGQTKMAVSARWQKHRRRAETETRNHPLYNALRKYGSQSFTVETIDTAETKGEAYRKERYHIAQIPEGLSYNLSPGGEMDGEAGAKIFWDSMTDRQSPEYKAYNAKLKAHGEKQYPRIAEAMHAGNAAWRKENAREAYKSSYRAIRIANKSQNRTPAKPDCRDRKTKLMWKYNRSKILSTVVAETWKNSTPEQLAARKKRISEGNKKFWEGVLDKDERAALTAKARAAIDRSVQGPAASRGIKKFWEDIRADPERYTAYMAERTASLHRTLEEKKGKPKDEDI